MNKLKTNDIVKVSKACKYPELVGATGVITWASQTDMHFVEFEDSFIIREYGTEDWVSNQFYLPEYCLYLYSDPQNDHIDFLNEKIENLETNVDFLRVCLSISEKLREDQADKITDLQNQLLNK